MAQRNLKKFDPMKDVPKTDEQARIALQRSSEGLTITLIGIYECHRALGESVLEAFILALEAHCKAAHNEEPSIAR